MTQDAKFSQTGHLRAVRRYPNVDHFGFPFDAYGREPSGFCMEFAFPHRTAGAVPLKVIATGREPTVVLASLDCELVGRNQTRRSSVPNESSDA